MITVTPIVKLDGERVSCAVDQLGAVPVVMSDMSIRWGRAGYFDAAEPALLTVRLWDSTDHWAERIRDSRAIGVPVEVLWTVGNRQVKMFTGAVATADAERLDKLDDDQRNVWEIVLTVADPTAALGNVFPLPGTLSSSHTMDDRAEWLKGLAGYGGLDVTELDYQQGYATALCSAVKVGQQSALELITAFYDGMSKDAWTYDPEGNAIRQCERHDWGFTTYLASFDDSRGAVMIAATDAEINGRTRPGVALSGCSLVLPDGIRISATTDTDINAVETSYKDAEGEDRKEWRESVPLGTSKRLLSNETWMRTGWGIRLQLNSAWDRARAEGRRPRHPNLVYRPGHEFATERLARWWLQTFEDARPAFINGDAAHAWLMAGATDWAPLLSPLGGTINYNGLTGWEFDLAVQWMHNRTEVTPMTWVKLQQIKWSSVSAPVPWWWDLIGMPRPPAQEVGTPTPERDVYWGTPGADQRQYRFDESVTWDDLKYLDNTSREIKDVLT